MFVILAWSTPEIIPFVTIFHYKFVNKFTFCLMLSWEWAHFIYVMAGPKHTMNLKSTCKHEMYDKNKI